MRKIIIGILIGILLAFPLSIYGQEAVSVIGKTIEGSFPLKINGERSTKDAIVVEGTSYIPVRAAGDLFGYDVSFIDSEVKLNKKAETVISEIEKEIDKWQQSILENEQKQVDYLKKFPDKYHGSEVEQVLKDRISNAQAKIAELETQLTQ